MCGSFTNWLTPIPMAPDGTGGGKVFAVVCNLPPGCVCPTCRLCLLGTLPLCGVCRAGLAVSGLCVCRLAWSPRHCVSYLSASHSQTLGSVV